jgi:hypothetical protein
VAPLNREFEMSLLIQDQQAIAFHAGNSLGDRRTTLTKALCNPGTHGRYTFFFEFKNRAQIHLGGIDQIAHMGNLPRI